jgi:penicillin-binding protein 1C
MISDAQRREAANEPIEASWRDLPQDLFDADASANGLMPSLTRIAQQHAGETIHLSIDAATQRQAAAATRRWLATLRDSHVQAAAVVVLDTRNGDLLASVGCCDDPAAKAVDLTICPRSSGSTLKPFIYAAAFDAGLCTPGTMLDDSPAAWSGYEPANYDHEFRGRITADEALAESRNVPALAMLSRVGVGRAVEVMRAMGLATLARTPDRYGLPLAIGGADVTPLELARAYAAMARAVCAHTASSVSFSAGLLPRAESCRDALRCLADPERTRNVCPAAEGLAPAWKTGTSSGHRDAWCAAVTPRRTVVVWLGNPDGSGSEKLIGQETAAPLALQILAAEDRDGGEGFAPPPAFTLGGDDAPRQSPATSLAMVCPSDGQEIVRDAALPTRHQRLALRAATAAEHGNGQLWWFVDGQYLAQSSDNQPVWWTPATGAHDVRVVDRSGRSAHARVTVTEDNHRPPG